MKKKNLIISFFFMCVLVGSIVVYLRIDTPPPDIRAVSWNATKAQIKANETAFLESETPGQLIYQRIVFKSIPAALGYYFNQEALVSVKYVAINRYEQFQGCVREFLRVQEEVERQYGHPELTTAENFRKAIWTAAATQAVLQTIQTSDKNFIWILTFDKEDQT